MVDVEYRRGKNSFQRELDSKLRDRKSRGLSADISDDESDDDGLGSDDDLLAQFNATSRFANRPGSAKQRGSPTAGLRGSPTAGLRGSPAVAPRDSPLGMRDSPALGSRDSPSLGSRGSPSLGSRGTPGLDSSFGRSGMTAEEILKHRQQATPPPKAPPRKGASPLPEKPLTKEDIIFGGRQTKKDASDLPLKEEKKQWQPPSFLRTSPLHMDEPKASPRLGDMAPLAPLRSPRHPEPRSRDLDGRQSPERGRKTPERVRESPEPRKRGSPMEGRKSFEDEVDNKKDRLKKHRAISESPEPKSRFVKPKDEKPKPEPRSRASSAGSEVFKKTERATPSYLVEESDSEDSADEFLRKVKEHKVTLSGRTTPDRDGRRTPAKDRKLDGGKSDGRKSPLDGRKSPLDGRKSPLDGRKSPKSNKKGKDDDEEEEARRISVYDMLVGDDEDDKKKKKKEKKDKKEKPRETPSPAPRRRPASATSSDRGRSPSPVKFEKPRPSSRSRDDDVIRKPPPAEQSSVCDDVEEDPMRKKIEGSGDAQRKRKGSRKQTSDRQTADDVIGQVADLNEKETRTMQYIEPDGEEKKAKKPPKVDPKIVRPKARYAVPSVTESRPESARSYSSSSEIRDSIYQDWYKERMRKAKDEAKRRKQQEMEEKEKKEKEKNDKMMENKLAYESWNKSKENWVKNKVKEKKKKEVDEEEKMKEKMEKQKDAEMAFKTWKESKDSKINDQVRKKKREEEKKKEEEVNKKLNRRSESEVLFESWKKKKDEVLINTHVSKKEQEREKRKKEEEERKEKEEEAKQSYERWLENSERRQNRMTLRMSQSMENLNTRPAWSPAKTLISTKNCRIK